MTLALTLTALLLFGVSLWLFLRGTKMSDTEPVRDCQCREQARVEYHRQCTRRPR